MRVLALGLILTCACGPAEQPRPPDPTGVVRPAEAPIQALTLEGPYSSLEEFCTQLEDQNRRAVTVARPIDDQGEIQEMSAADREELGSADRLDCRLDYYYEEDEGDEDAEASDDEFFGFDLPVEGPAQATGSGALLEARIVPFGEGDARCRVALRTGDGWYIQTAGVPCHAEDGSLTARTEILTIEDLLTGEQPEAAWRYVTQQRGPADSPTRTVETETLVLCGVGDSGVPRCYEGVVVAGRRLARTGEQADGPATVEGTEVESTFQLQVQYGSGGIALIGDMTNAATVGADTADRIRRQLGRHAIEFP